LFAREDYVEEAWRIVEPVLKKNTPVYQYAPNTWGPSEVECVSPPGGWHNAGGKEAFAVASEAA
jgi:glucose-6-phosphate 1-dehydrogenase